MAEQAQLVLGFFSSRNVPGDDDDAGGVARLRNHTESFPLDMMDPAVPGPEPELRPHGLPLADNLPEKLFLKGPVGGVGHFQEPGTGLDPCPREVPRKRRAYIQYEAFPIRHHDEIVHTLKDELKEILAQHRLQLS